MKFFENFSNLFDKKKTKNPDESVNANPDELEASAEENNKESVLNDMKLRFEEIEALKEKNKNLKNKIKINKEIQGLKNQFKKDFGVNYHANFDKIQQYDSQGELDKDGTLKPMEVLTAEDMTKEEAGEADKKIKLGGPEIEDVEVKELDNKESKVRKTEVNEPQMEEVKTEKSKTEEVNDVQADLEPGPAQNYRRHLENLKIKEGEIKNGQYQEIANVSLELAEELKELSDSLVAEKLNANLDINLENLAVKTGLTKEEIQDVYRAEEDNLISEAKKEINKNSSNLKKIGLVAGKSAIYIGAGVLSTTSAVATLGIGVGASISIIAGARILDRVITEGRLKKKIDEKVKEIKAKKTEIDKFAIQDRLAAAISLKKKIEISRVNLDDKGERTKLIDEYIEEQSRSGLMQIAPDKMMEQKDQIIRAIEGLDNIDKSNLAREEKMNKKGIFDKLKNIEDIISGKSSREKVASTAVFVGLGIAAREIPGIRQAMSAYAGYRLGALAGDYIVNRSNNHQETPNEIYGNYDYNEVRTKLLDRNFQKNNPTEYLCLKKMSDAYENKKAEVGLEGLNKSFEQKIKDDKLDNRFQRVFKMTARTGGAMLGLLGGQLIHNLARHIQNESAPTSSTPRTNNVVAEELLSKKGVTPASSSPSAISPANALYLNKLDSTATSVDSLMTSKTGGGTDIPTQEIISPSNNKPDILEDTISNQGMKAGTHDSVWRSTEQIFKDHAQKLGYQGDVNNKSALEDWAQDQTGKTLNNSGDINDKVFEGNKVVLEQDAQGNYRVSVEEATGLKPGHLEHEVLEPKHENIKSDDLPEQEVLTQKGKIDYEELKKDFIEREKSATREKYKFLFNDQLESRASGTIEQPVLDDVNNIESDNLETSGQTESMLIDHDPKSPIFSEADLNQPTTRGEQADVSVSAGKTNAAEITEVPKSNEVKNPLPGQEVHNLETVSTSKAFSSIEDLRNLPDQQKVDLGDLTMTKRGHMYDFKTADGVSFKMTFNKTSDFAHSDQFSIAIGDRALEGSKLDEAIPFKQKIYDNLPDKRSSLAKQLLKEIMRNKEQTEFLSDFK